MTNYSPRGGGGGYQKIEANSETRGWLYYYYRLAFSFKFIIAVCLLVTAASFFSLVWGKSQQSNGGLEELAKQRHAGMRKSKIDSSNQVPIRKQTILRTLAPDLKLVISQCPHPQEASPALLNSIRLLDNDPVCKKALFASACQLEKGLLYDAALPVTCQNDAKLESIPGTPRILFVIDVNSAAARQIERLLIHLYRKTHYYLLLIPNCLSEQVSRLKRFRNVASNVRLLQYDAECPAVATEDVSLQQTPATWRFIMQNSTTWNWDYLLSLDSFDFPLLNIDKLTTFLQNHAGLNFLEAYSISHDSDYVRNISSAACEDGGRRWPIGQSTPPAGLSYYQGPPWYLLTRRFLEYALFSKDDPLVVGLTKFASMTPFPAQLLFHTLAHNGRFCHAFVNESLRLTKYHIYDQRSARGLLTRQDQEQLSSWTFTSKDFTYLSPVHKAQFRGNNRSVFIDQKFFARRFDPTISQQIVQDIESTLYERPMFPIQTPRLHSYWYNLWTNAMTDRRKSTLRYAAVARLLGDLCLKRLKRCSSLSNSKTSSSSTSDGLLTKLTLFRDFDLNDGLILSMQINCTNDDDRPVSVIPLQCYVNFQHHEKIKSSVKEITDLGNDLLHMRVGSDYDPTDNTFRNYAGSVIVDNGERFGLRTQWVPGELGMQYQFAWLDPADYVVGTTFETVGPLTSLHFQPKAPDLQYLQYGIWTAAILNEAKVVGATEFLVLPESATAYNRFHPKERLRWAKQFFEVNRICAPITFSKKVAKTCKCSPPSIPSCESTGWSTLASDTKSNFPLSIKRRHNK